MKKITLLFLLLVMVSCTIAKTGKQKKKSSAATELVYIGVHHTMCFGTCPDYKVEINQDGMATYTAIRFNADTGIYKKNIGKAKAKEIFDLCRKYRIDTCREMYENRIPDLPGINITLGYKKSKRTIYSAGFGPEFLTEIAGAIDEAGKKPDGDKTWKKTGMPKIN